MVELGIYLPL